MNLIRATQQGLYCEAGDFFIDPWKPVEKAVITHGHSDHAQWGSKLYYSSEKCLPILHQRLGESLPVHTKKWGEKFKIGPTWVSFHPAGHILGSAQVRIEYKNQIWVASGDYKRTPDPSCDAFEIVPCNTFISEATFALPVYKWDRGEVTAKKILDWWMGDQDRPSLLFCYALGKAQRILAELKLLTDREVFTHGAVEPLNEIYRKAGVELLNTKSVMDQPKGYNFKGDLIIAPPSAHRSPWMKRFKEPQTAFASGWMQVRGTRRRKGYEKGFVLSDHADWNELNQTIQETGAEDIYLTHGRTDVLSRFLEEQGKTVRLFETQYSAEEEAS
ncbi:ligase-associated DNA damage response exonuclease [Bdellovibrio reynosensis]|uniref:Ligase-associated DNA damage response exonuclease n=1 Tax=Bdellovibrio reynosensis TaxID=2835041 RepID=A0ABY4CE96_9BACT|nr:ligase-associated DNA damage response exonuclease [Bdellovibrio reynosensis]UOF00535.1 ligase-associated DNA damage response exonuclease [Bdellovibrio reynosensis]